MASMINKRIISGSHLVDSLTMTYMPTASQITALNRQPYGGHISIATRPAEGLFLVVSGSRRVPEPVVSAFMIEDPPRWDRQSLSPGSPANDVAMNLLVRAAVVPGTPTTTQVFD
jgi:hypothetical protein